ncbi:hypothetical protein Hoch_5041 [Haliangium ochraceum DSM 14365]|uniref:Uncharacterized protein n=2 Tax=Haliangium ochraceum TaxID=80816 RepID=D0LVG8_HALO1|nr:hypothetical protein Hoch_5041 [Haliangium ochraceum DSM 14365]
MHKPTVPQPPPARGPRKRTLPMLLGALLLGALLVACGGEESSSEPQSYTYVIDSLSAPQTAAEAVESYGLDVDGKADDSNRGVDNALGSLLATLSSMADLDVASALQAGVDDGSIILLAQLDTPDLEQSDAATVGLYLGANPNPAACADDADTACRLHLQGDASFEISADTPSDTTLSGALESGGFAMGADSAPGTVPFVLPALDDGAEPLQLTLVGARVQVGAVSEDGLAEGVLGGAVPFDEIENTILPLFYEGIADTVATDCSGEAPACCTADSAGAGILEFFDADDDCAVSLEEFSGNFFLSLFLNPDVDLFDDTGAYNPNTDGVNDAMSLGVGFTATGASFAQPQ